MTSKHIAVCARNLGKYYRIYGPQEKNPLFRDAIVNSFKAPLKIFDRTRTTDGFWALKDVSFNVEEGEVVGFIGRNGAGKSTLLKVLSQITLPTEGTVEICGRVGSLLEVGTGFHSELTGRENIYFSGSILGMKKREIESNFDEILRFSEIGKFIDTPVKRYSSGMYVRLAFAVAAHLDSEILIVDEVLAVGDFAFQKKCISKMSKVAREGRTVLFVSHNMVTVQNLCETCYILDNGKIVDSGLTHEVISSYLNQESSLSSERIWADPSSAPGDDQIRINYASIRPENFSEENNITTSTPFMLTVRFWNFQPDIYISIKFRLSTDIQGVVIFESMPQFEPGWKEKLFPVGLFESTCEIPGNLLNRGKYRVHISFIRNYREVIFEIEDILRFQINDPSDNVQFKLVNDLSNKSSWYGKPKGILRPVFNWNTTMIQNGPEDSVKNV